MKRKKLFSLGDLPVGLRGKFYGVPYNVLVQYDIEGKVTVMIYDERDGNLIVQVTGKNKKTESDVLASYAWKEQEFGDAKLKSQISRDAYKFVSQLSDEVNAYNKKQKSEKPKKEKKVKEVKGRRAPKPKNIRMKPVVLVKEPEPERAPKNVPKDIPMKDGPNFIIVKKTTARDLYRVNPSALEQIAGMKNGKHTDVKSHNVRINVLSGTRTMYDVRDMIEQELTDAIVQYHVLKAKKRHKTLTDPFEVGTLKKMPQYIRSLKKQIREQNRLIASSLR